MRAAAVFTKCVSPAHKIESAGLYGRWCKETLAAYDYADDCTTAWALKFHCIGSSSSSIIDPPCNPRHVAYPVCASVFRFHLCKGGNNSITGLLRRWKELIHLMCSEQCLPLDQIEKFPKPPCWWAKSVSRAGRWETDGEPPCEMVRQRGKHLPLSLSHVGCQACCDGAAGYVPPLRWPPQEIIPKAWVKRVISIKRFSIWADPSCRLTWELSTFAGWQTDWPVPSGYPKGSMCALKSLQFLVYGSSMTQREYS